MRSFRPWNLVPSHAKRKCWMSFSQQRGSISARLHCPSTSSSSSTRYFPVPGSHEWIENYTVGGYHPVHLGDVFKEQYRVLRKLGNGKYATVWLARDTVLDRYVVLKVCVASDMEEAWMEAKLLTELRGVANVSHPNHPPVSCIVDAFVHNGPNGDHVIMCLEPLGHTLQQLINAMEFRCDTELEIDDIGGLRRLSRQMIEALEFTHSKRIVHRGSISPVQAQGDGYLLRDLDVQPQNFMFELRKALVAESGAFKQEPRRMFPLERLDRQPLDRHAPAYIVESQPLENLVIENPRLPVSRLILTDFGAATTFDNANDGQYAYPLPLRAPEIVLGLPLSEKSDIWALGCSIWLLVTLTDLFYVDGFAEGKDRDDEHLQSMIEVLGPMPERVSEFWKRRQSMIDEHGSLLAERLQDPLSEPLSTKLSQFRPKAMSVGETALFQSFMQTIFQYEPDQRPSASELLRHPWIHRDQIRSNTVSW